MTKSNDDYLGVPPSAVTALGTIISIGFCLSILQNVISGATFLVLRELPPFFLGIAGILFVRLGMVRLAKVIVATAVTGSGIMLTTMARYGIFDSAFLLFPAAIIVAALLLGPRVYALFTVLLLAGVAGLGWAQIAGHIGREFGHPFLLRHLIDKELVLAGTALIAGLLATAMRRTLNRALSNQAELAVANGELERKAGQLRESEEKLQQTIELAVDAIFVGDYEGHIVRANARAAELTGYSPDELIGMHARQLFSSEELQRAPLRFDLLREGKQVLSERALTRKDGSLVQVELSSKLMPDGTYHAFMRDISLRRRMEERASTTQRLESLGLFAGGIAHDFNNLLSGIFGCIELARTSLANDDDAAESAELLGDAQRSIHRARDLSNQLLTFSKGGSPVKVLMRMEDLLRDSTALVLAGRAVRLTLETAPDLWPCELDPGQISQVVNNLLINAVQAMQRGGDLSVTARNTMHSHGNVHFLREGPYVEIAVTDSGPGIAPELLPRIFDPFVTSKARGTGLGLAISHSIVNRHGGYIGVESTAGQGTRFTILLPATPGASVTSRPEAKGSSISSSLRLLVMDDDEAILKVMPKLLQSAGFQTATAKDGADAVAQYEEALGSGKPFNAVILDLTVRGGMGGVATLRRLREIDPRVIAVAASGYSNDPVMSDPARYGFAGTIPKPFTQKDLLLAIENLPRRS